MTGPGRDTAAGSRLKGATRLLLHDIGSLDAGSAIAGVSRSQLARYQNTDAPDFITVQTVAILEAQDGVRPHVTMALAQINGNILVRCPEIHGDGKWVADFSTLARTTGAALSGIGESLADGIITAVESRALNLRHRLAELQAAVASMDKHLADLEEAERP